MKNLRKSFLSLILCFAMVLVSVPSVYAQEIISYDELGVDELGDPSEGVVTHFTAEVEEDEELDEEDSRTVSYVPNDLAGALTPQSDGIKVSFVNLGVDAISSVSFNISIYNYAGGFVAQKTDTIKNLKVGTTTYTWKIAKSASVYEDVYLSGIGEDGGEQYVFSTSTQRYNFAGGRYGSMQALGGQRHHMPSSKALSETGALSRENGAAVRMITADHYKTASYGSKDEAVEFRAKEITQIRNGKFLAAQKLGIQDLKNLFGSKYSKACDDMVAYTKGLGYSK